MQRSAVTIRHMYMQPENPPIPAFLEGGDSMIEDETGQDPHIQLILAGVFLVIVAGGVVDLILDRPDRFLSPHVIFEVAMVGISLLAATHLARGWYSATRSVRELRNSLARREEEWDAWRARAGTLIAGLSDAVNLQFTDWHLSPAERETALLLLKGFSTKRIAKTTDRSDRTVRQHAVAVYKKSGLAGRAELAAFFLGDLTLA